MQSLHAGSQSEEERTKLREKAKEYLDKAEQLKQMVKSQKGTRYTLQWCDTITQHVVRSRTTHLQNNINVIKTKKTRPNHNPLDNGV